MRLWVLFAMMITASTATALDFTFENIDGGALSLSNYEGRPILVVNTASRCGFTGQLSGLQKLHETYNDQGLVVLAVPSNDFNMLSRGTWMLKLFLRPLGHPDSCNEYSRAKKDNPVLEPRVRTAKVK